MEYICVDDEYYDPYFILGVSREDSNEHITKAYKQKAKKYHPDKAPKESLRKFEKRFNIVVQSFDYIKKKRAESQVKTDHISIYNTDEFITEPVENNNYETLKSMEDYDKLECEVVNQFNNKKFTNKSFNNLFLYNKNTNETDEDRQTLVLHKSTDGFYGYNTADLGNCALVSSFNGLLIVADDLKESGKGYWNSNYSDYRQSFARVAKNPKKVLKVPKSYQSNTLDRFTVKKNITKDTILQENTNVLSFKQQNEILKKKVLEDLLKKDEHDKTIVLKHKKHFNNDLVQQALEGRLERSANLIETVHQHYNVKRL